MSAPQPTAATFSASSAPKVVDPRMIALCRHIESAEASPTLRELAEFIGLSEAHTQRLFSTQIGVSPRNYAKMVREERLRHHLQTNVSVTDSIYRSGFTSVSQLYGSVAATLGMAPSEFQSGGANLEIIYAVVPSPIGHVLIAATSRGICKVDISTSYTHLEMRLKNDFARAKITRSNDQLETTTSLIVRYLSGEVIWPRLPVDVRATAFQSRVWNALRDITPGTTMSYSLLAKVIGSPNGARAVARACATNPIALLIPCHRIVPLTGEVGEYRWGSKRKKKLLDIERHFNDQTVHDS